MHRSTRILLAASALSSLGNGATLAVGVLPAPVDAGSVLEARLGAILPTSALREQLA
jgi:hypothetical protein